MRHKTVMEAGSMSLISIIVKMSPRCETNALKAYSEAACEVMNLVEEDDQKMDNFLNKLADRLFKTL